MSRYAVLVCSDCKVQLWLGKAIFEDGPEQPSRFQIGGSTGDGESLNSENRILNKVLWKMLADHAGHSIRVLVEGKADYGTHYEYVEIGGDTKRDISFEEYLNDWLG